MDPFELLKADHKKVAGLFERLESSSGKAKLDVFEQINNELELHTHIEEKIFYPALKRPAETHDLTLEAYEEHAVVKTLLAELSNARTASDEWQAKIKVLRENVEHHVEEEENELFDKAADALDSDKLQALGDQMAAEKARKEKRSTAATVKNKTTKSSKEAKTGIIATIANFVGLGSKKGKASSSKSSKESAGTKTSKQASKTSERKTANKASKKVAGAKTSGKQKTSKATKKSTGRSAPSKKTTGTKGRSSAKKRA